MAGHAPSDATEPKYCEQQNTASEQSLHSQVGAEIGLWRYERVHLAEVFTALRHEPNGGKDDQEARANSDGENEASGHGQHFAASDDVNAKR